MAKPLRLLVGLCILFLPILFGWYGRHPLIIPILGATYVPLYVFGKMGAWRALSDAPRRTALLKATPVTFIVQTLLVAVCYLIGLGLAALFTIIDIAPTLKVQDAIWLAVFIAIIIPVTLFIAYTERPTADTLPQGDAGQPLGRPEQSAVAFISGHQITMGDDDDFAVHTRTITPSTFYQGPHSGRRNATGIALTDIVDHRGDRPKRTPKEASDAMIMQAEQRLAVALPETLRTLYKIQDGGALPTYYVPIEDGVPQIYDKWITAFADDYNDLKPLDQLEILQDSYDEYYDPEYSDESAKDHWIPGADKLVILAARTGYGTALDYRKGPDPGVLLYDHDNVPGKMEIMIFESFDAFFSALREIDSDHRQAKIKDAAYGLPPNLLDPDAFWASGNAGAGITEQEWHSIGAALGVTLSATLHPFYAAANGGISKFTVAVPEHDSDPPLKVFPTGPYIQAGSFLKAEQFVSVATLSDRLDFIDDRLPWRDRYDDADKLIVISAAFDMALMLDYRAGATPTVLFSPNLDAPDRDIAFASVEDFLSCLRRYGKENIDARREIGDPHISARLANAETFWMENRDAGPVDNKVASAFQKTWNLHEHGLPTAIKDIYAIQNGGAVRFRYTPPQVVTPYGQINYDAAAKTWLDAFPDGLLPMERWKHFDEWRKTHGLALGQSLYDFTDRIHAPTKEDTDDTKLNLFVIGDHTSLEVRMLTLLDLSIGPFQRNRTLMTLRYDTPSDTFACVFGPMMADNIFSGLFQTVKAYKADL